MESLKEIKVAALNIETATNEYVFIPGENRDKYLQEMNEQKNKFNENLNIYEDLVNKYFPDETNRKSRSAIFANVFIQTADKLVKLRQNAPLITLSPSPALDALSIKNEFEHALLKVIDSAISNEIDEIQKEPIPWIRQLAVLPW